MALVELLKEAGGDNETLRNQCIAHIALAMVYSFGSDSKAAPTEW